MATMQPPALATARKCVLIVEDNPLNMKLFSAMLAAQDYVVLEATDGSDGLDLAQRKHPDLIIMDIQLPGMSGLEVTRSLKASDATRDIPIIATTAFALRGDEERIRAGGCDGYMAKPIAVSEFLELVESIHGSTRSGATSGLSALRLPRTTSRRVAPSAASGSTEWRIGRIQAGFSPVLCAWLIYPCLIGLTRLERKRTSAHYTCPIFDQHVIKDPWSVRINLSRSQD